MTENQDQSHKIERKTRPEAGSIINNTPQNGHNDSYLQTEFDQQIVKLHTSQVEDCKDRGADVFQVDLFAGIIDLNPVAIGVLQPYLLYTIRPYVDLIIFATSRIFV